MQNNIDSVLKINAVLLGINLNMLEYKMNNA